MDTIHLRTAPRLLCLVLAGGLLPSCGGGGGGGVPAPVVRTAPADPNDPSAPPPLPVATQLRRAFGSLATGRYAHSATLLGNGRVLIAGGTRAGTALTDRAELFEPSSEVCIEIAAPMRLGRSGHSATWLPGGRVLLAGGWYESALGQLSATERAELFDPATGTFSETGPMTRARVDHAAILLGNGKVLITGGSVLEGAFLRDLDDAEIYDPGTGSFTALPARMAHTRATHQLLDVTGSKFLLAGGSDADLGLELFDAVTSQFSTLPPVAGDGARYNPCGATFGSGAAVVAGGSLEAGVLWVAPGGVATQNTGSPLRQPRAYATATRVSDTQILVAGGVDFADGGLMLPTCDWIVAGGIGGARTYPTALRFDQGMAVHSATRLADGRVVFCGGVGSDDQQSGLVEVYVFTP